jgi:hypothetical protein
MRWRFSTLPINTDDMKSLFLLIILATSTVTFAQLTLMPRAGMSTSTLRINEDGSFKTSHVHGFVGGLGVNVPVTTKLSIQPDLLFVQRGAVCSSLSSFPYGYPETHEENVTMTSNHLEIPVILRMTFGKKVKYFTGVGTYFGYALNGNVKTHDIVVEYRDNAEHSRSEHFNSFDLSFNEPVNAEEYPYDATYIANRLDAGIQVSAGVQIWRLFLDVRYSLGLTRIDTHEQVKHQGWQFSIGVPLKIKKNTANKI